MNEQQQPTKNHRQEGREGGAQEGRRFLKRRWWVLGQMPSEIKGMNESGQGNEATMFGEKETAGNPRAQFQVSGNFCMLRG